MQKMKVWITFAILIGMWAATIAILLTPETPNVGGLEHSQFAKMDAGGDGQQRHESIFIAAWAFGALLIALFVSFLMWGTQSSNQWPLIVVGGLLYEGVFAAMCWAYWQSLVTSEVAFIGPFPASVSWLLFGIWLIPGVFIVLYVAFFDRWIYPPDTAKTFELLLAQRGKD